MNEMKVHLNDQHNMRYTNYLNNILLILDNNNKLSYILLKLYHIKELAELNLNLVILLILTVLLILIIIITCMYFKNWAIKYINKEKSKGYNPIHKGGWIYLIGNCTGKCKK